MATFSLTYTNSEVRLLAPTGKHVSVARFALPENLVHTGRIADPNAFADIISQAMNQATPEPIRANHVVVGLPEEQAFVKVLHLPTDLKPVELKSAARYQWRNILPIPEDQVYFDCCYINPKRQPKLKSKKKVTTSPVLLVAYPRDIVSTLLTVLSRVGLTAKLILPRSFGIARLYSPAQHQAAITLESGEGQHVSASVVLGNHTLFSTTLHASVDDLRVGKQVANVRDFFSRNVGGDTPVLKDVVILPGPFVANLQATLGSQGIPSLVAPLPSIVKDFDPAQSGLFLDLLGLLKNRFKLSIIPPELVAARIAGSQLAVFRSMTVILFTILSLMAYFSFIFYVSLESNAKSKVAYSSEVTRKVAVESQTLAKQTGEINTLLARVAPLAASRGRLHPLLATLDDAAATHHVSVATITAETASRSLSVEASARSQNDITAFVQTLKSIQSVSDLKQEILPADGTQSDLRFRLTMTITAGGEIP